MTSVAATAARPCPTCGHQEPRPIPAIVASFATLLIVAALFAHGMLYADGKWNFAPWLAGLATGALAIGVPAFLHMLRRSGR